MNAHTIKLPYPRLPLLVWGILATLVSGITIAVLMISAQASGNEFAAVELQKTGTAPGIAVPILHAYRCDGCGVIESMKKIDPADEAEGISASGQSAARRRGASDAEPLGNYEITIRLQDGTMRVIRDARPAHWRHGEPVTIIAGADR